MANKIIIPHSFLLNGKEVIIEFDNDYCDNEKLFGEADFTEKKIILADKNKGKPIPKNEIDKTFFHELTHILLDGCNRHNLKYNESFVEEFSQRLYEFSKTAKYI